MCLLDFEKSIDKHCVFFKNIYLSLFLKRIKGVPSLIQLRWEEMGKGPHSEAYACLTFVCTSDCVETLGVATYTARPTETKPEKKKGGRRQRNSISQLIVFFSHNKSGSINSIFFTPNQHQSTNSNFLSQQITISHQATARRIQPSPWFSPICVLFDNLIRNATSPPQHARNWNLH